MAILSTKLFFLCQTLFFTLSLAANTSPGSIPTTGNQPVFVPLGDIKSDDGNIFIAKVDAINHRTIRIHSILPKRLNAQAFRIILSDRDSTEQNPSRKLWLKSSSRCTSEDIYFNSPSALTFELPSDLTLHDVASIQYRSKCTHAPQAFLHLNKNPIVHALPPAPSTCHKFETARISSTFPTLSTHSCRILSPRLQFRWHRHRNILHIEVLLQQLSSTHFVAIATTPASHHETLQNSSVLLIHGHSPSVRVHHVQIRQPITFPCALPHLSCFKNQFVTRLSGGTYVHLGIFDLQSTVQNHVVRIRYSQLLDVTSIPGLSAHRDHNMFYVSWTDGTVTDGSLSFHDKAPLHLLRRQIPIHFNRPASDACTLTSNSKPSLPLHHYTDHFSRKFARAQRLSHTFLYEYSQHQDFSSDCAVTFDGNEETFARCYVNIETGLDVYFTVKDGTVDTLFKYKFASSGGYVAFGWGYSKMVGSSAIVVRKFSDGTANITNYFLEEQSTPAVYPVYSSINAAASADVTSEYIAGRFSQPLSNISTDSSPSFIWASGQIPSPENSTNVELSLHTEKGSKTVSLDGLEQNNQSNASNCLRTFKGVDVKFQHCFNISADLEVLFNVENDQVDTLFRARGENNIYVGFGWGYSEMVGSMALVAYEAKGAAELVNYELTSTDVSGVKPKTVDDLSELEADVSSGFVAGRFKRKLIARNVPDLSNEVNSFIWAIGSLDSPPSLVEHSSRGSGTVDFQSGTISQSNGASKLYRAHGFFMSFAWLVLVPVAILAMRFFKKYNPTTFNIHRGLAITTLIFTLVGFLLVIFKASHTQRTHMIFGYTVISLSLLQVTSGLLRPDKSASTRSFWYLVHMTVGILAYILAFSNILVGIQLPQSDGHAGWVALASLIFALEISVFLIFSLMKRKFPTVQTTSHHGGRTGPPTDPAEDSLVYDSGNPVLK